MNQADSPTPQRLGSLDTYCGLVMFLDWIVDVNGFRAWTFPLVVIGMNSIAIYVMSWAISRFIIESLQIHPGQDVFLVFGKAYQTLLSGTAVIIVDWLILYWMYTNRVFVRI